MPLRIVIVGGGPTGTAIAHNLASWKTADNEKPVEVFVYERYPAATIYTPSSNHSRAYVIALNYRGQSALRRLQIVPENITNAVVADAVVTHRPPKKKTTQLTPPHVRPLEDKYRQVIAKRQDMTSYFEQLAEKSGATLHHEHELVDVDWKQKIATFRHRGLIHKVGYDLLIGADGTKSVVRTLLDQHCQTEQPRKGFSPSFRVEATECDRMEYQVAVIPQPGSEILGSVWKNDTKQLKRKRPLIQDTDVHSWNSKKYNAMCLAFPIQQSVKTTNNTHNPLGLLFAVIFPGGMLEAFRQQAKQNGKVVQSDQSYEAALESLLHDVPKHVRSDIIDQLKGGDFANGGNCVWVSSLGSAEHSVALVGDSGHGQWPSLGQGCCASLESAAVFCQTVRDLTTSKDSKDCSSWATRVVQVYNERRYEDARATVDLTYDGIGGKESRGRGNAPLSFKLQVGVAMLWHVLSFGWMPQPALFRLFKGDDIPYSTLRKQMHRERWLLRATCLGMTLPVVVKYILPMVVSK